MSAAPTSLLDHFRLDRKVAVWDGQLALNVRPHFVTVGVVPTESLVTIGNATEESLVAMTKSVPLGRLGDPTDVAGGR